MYNKFETNFAKTNTVTLNKTKYTKNYWVSENSESLREKRDKAKLKYLNSKLASDQKIWKDLRDQTNNSFKNDKIKQYENLCKEVTEAAKQNDIKRIYKTINIISGKIRKNYTTLVKKMDGTDPINNDDCINEWKNYFDKLLNNQNTNQIHEAAVIEPAETDLPISTEDFTIDEVKTAIKSLKNGKSPGIDLITSEALKFCGDKGITALKDICNNVLNTGVSPKQWNTSIIIPVPKKGNRTEMNNYRGIALMSIAAKTFNRMILNRIYEPINQILRPNQAGFRRGLSCAHPINTLKRIMQGANTKQLPLITIFVDLKKAFDSIDRQKMWQILRSYGVPLKIVNAIKSIYQNSECKIKIGNQYSQNFYVKTGVLQGDTLSPFLFNIVIDYVFKNIPKEYGFITEQEPLTRINDLCFADDSVLFDDHRFVLVKTK